MQQQFRGYGQHAPTPPRPGSGPHGVPPRRGGIGPMMSAGPHPQAPLSAAQLNQQHQAQQQANHLAKLRSRKPTDKNLPDGVEEIVIDHGYVVDAYRQLRDFERRLDATMTRKRLDIVDSLSRNTKRYKTMRVWISNTVEDQYWQNNSLNVDTFDFSSNLEASYRLKIEGRLLEDEEDPSSDDDEPSANGGNKMDTDSVPAAKPAKPAKAVPAKHGQRYRFSHFFKALTVEFDKSRVAAAAAAGRETTIEWKKPERTPAGAANLPAMADFDEITFKRPGDENVNVIINLYRHEDPERFELSPELAEIVDMKEATRQEAVMAVWEYIKLNKLQEDEEKRNFRCDDMLKKIIPRDSGFIPHLNEYLTPHLRPLSPIKLPYTIRVDEEFHKNPSPTIYDIRVLVDDPLRTRQSSSPYLPFPSNPSYATTLKEIAALDDQLATLMQAVAHSKAKHAFLSGMARDPVGFVKGWLSSQKRDLDIILGEANRAGRDGVTGGLGAGGGEEAVTAGDEWRRGGKESVWASQNARESVNVLLAKQPLVLR